MLDQRIQKKRMEEAFFNSESQVFTPNVAFVTPNHLEWHVGNLDQYLRQANIAQYAKLLGHEVFVPFGAHPTGNPTHKMVENLLFDLEQGYVDRLSKNGFTDEDLDDFISWSNSHESHPNILEVKNVEEAAPIVIDYMMHRFREQLKDFNVIDIDFENSSFSTIDPAYKKFTKWTIDRAIETGMIHVGPIDAPYCKHNGGHLVDASSDGLEVDFSSREDIEINRWDLEFLVLADGKKILNFSEGPLSRTGKKIENIDSLDFINENKNYFIISISGNEGVLDNNWVLDEKQLEYLRSYYESKEINVKIENEIQGIELKNTEFASQKNERIGTVNYVDLRVPYFKGKVTCKEHGTELSFVTKRDILYDYLQQWLIEDSLGLVEDMTIHPKSFKLALLKPETGILTTMGPRRVLRPEAEALGSKSHIYLTQDMEIGYQSPESSTQVMEPLSDSNIYMLFFRLKQHLNNGKLSVDHLTPEFFNYALLQDTEKGDVNQIAESTGLSIDELEFFRQDIQKTYQNWINIFGNEHNTAHGPFSIMNYAGLGLEELAPSGIISFGMVSLEGKELSKSKGNTLPLERALQDTAEEVSGFAEENSLNWRNVAGDAVRYYMLVAQEPDKDFNWKKQDLKTSAKNMIGTSRTIQKQIYTLEDASSESRINIMDAWMHSRILAARDAVMDEMSKYEVRAASLRVADLIRDFSFYSSLLEASGQKVDFETTVEYIEMHNHLSSMFTPYVASHLQKELSKVASGASPEIGILTRDKKRDFELEKRIYLTGGFGNMESIPDEDIQKAIEKNRNEYLREIGAEINKQVGIYLGTQQGTIHNVLLKVGTEVEKEVITNILEKDEGTLEKFMQGISMYNKKAAVKKHNLGEKPFAVEVNPEIKTDYEIIFY